MATAPPADPSPVTEQKPSCNCPDLSTIQKVDIDKDGTYKYVAFTVCDPKVRTGAIPVVIVRGYKRFIDFEEIIEEVQDVLQPLICEPFMGGRITHNSVNNTIHIFGTALGVDRGKPDREFIAKLVREQYPGFTVTTGEKDIVSPPPSPSGTTEAPATPATATP